LWSASAAARRGGAWRSWWRVRDEASGARYGVASGGGMSTVATAGLVFSQDVHVCQPRAIARARLARWMCDEQPGPRVERVQGAKHQRLQLSAGCHHAQPASFAARQRHRERCLTVGPRLRGAARRIARVEAEAIEYQRDTRSF